MSFDSIGYALIGLAIFVFISVRQLGWQQVNLGKMMKMPLILAGFGVFMAVKTMSVATFSHVGALDILIIAAEAIVAIIGGVVMGNLAQIATVNGRTSSRLRPAGLAVWFAFIASRIGFDVLAHVVGADLAASTTLIMFMVAIVKGVQALTMSGRVSRHEATDRAEYAVGSRL